MKTPADASRKIDGERHQRGMEIKDDAVKVLCNREMRLHCYSALHA